MEGSSLRGDPSIPSHLLATSFLIFLYPGIGQRFVEYKYFFARFCIALVAL